MRSDESKRPKVVKSLNRMNWEMLAAIGQLAAVFVGIPSLLYLAVQIREQTKERRQSAVNALTVQWGDLTRALHENAEFTAIYLRGVQSFHDLDAVSKLRFSAFQNRFFQNFEGMYYSRCEGILTPALWGEIERTMSDFLAYDGDAPMVGDTEALAYREVSQMSSTPSSREAISQQHTQLTILSAIAKQNNVPPLPNWLRRGGPGNK